MPLNDTERSLSGDRLLRALRVSSNSEQSARMWNTPALSARRGLGPLQEVEQGRGLLLDQKAPIRRGVIDAFVNTCQRWGLTEAQQVVLLGFAGDEAFGLQVLRGRRFRTSQDVKDRAAYVLGISIGLGALFDENSVEEVRWMTHPHPQLDGQTPLSTILSGRMANLIDVVRIVATERELG